MTDPKQEDEFSKYKEVIWKNTVPNVCKNTDFTLQKIESAYNFINQMSAQSREF